MKRNSYPRRVSMDNANQVTLHLTQTITNMAAFMNINIITQNFLNVELPSSFSWLESKDNQLQLRKCNNSSCDKYKIPPSPPSVVDKTRLEE
jgi:hypothetical protein